jgi:factor associated with neutral sphingomyelinase activation
MIPSTQSFLALPKPRTKSRFNLLLLEHGECYFLDFAVYHYAKPNSNGGCDDEPPLDVESLPWSERVRLRQPGRLKLCSRSLVFEPADVRLPILRLSFRQMSNKSRVERYERGGAPPGGAFFSVRCASVVEMKANAKIGPWHTRNLTSGSGGGDAVPMFVFELLHTGLAEFLSSAEALRSSATANAARNSGGADVDEVPRLVPHLGGTLGARAARPRYVVFSMAPRDL